MLRVSMPLLAQMEAPEDREEPLKIGRRHAEDERTSASRLARDAIGGERVEDRRDTRSADARFEPGARGGIRRSIIDGPMIDAEWRRW